MGGGSTTIEQPLPGQYDNIVGSSALPSPTPADIAPFLDDDEPDSGDDQPASVKAESDSMAEIFEPESHVQPISDKGDSSRGVVADLPTDKEDVLQEVVADHDLSGGETADLANDLEEVVVDRDLSRGETADLANDKGDVSEVVVADVADDKGDSSQGVVADLANDKEDVSQEVVADRDLPGGETADCAPEATSDSGQPMVAQTGTNDVVGRLVAPPEIGSPTTETQLGGSTTIEQPLSGQYDNIVGNSALPSPTPADIAPFLDD